MQQDFFEAPILNSPYAMPSRHWVIADGYPTNTIAETRRRTDFVSAIPDAKRRRRVEEQGQLDLSAGIATTEDGSEFAHTFVINELRQEIETWRRLPSPAQWKVTPTTQALLRHWRSLMADDQAGIRPFFCQLEAVETAIWLAEV
ncbi:MAG: restriction endonuclease, partial [Pseudomonadota bacterium]